MQDYIIIRGSNDSRQKIRTPKEALDYAIYTANRGGPPGSQVENLLPEIRALLAKLTSAQISQSRLPRGAEWTRFHDWLSDTSITGRERARQQSILEKL